MQTETSVYLGVDVGTGSVRAGVFDEAGTLLGVAKHDITMFSEQGYRFEQSSAEIWAAVCQSVKQALVQANTPSAAVKGLSFDATCSMVVVGPDGDGLPVGQHGDAQRNVMVWMDQRATKQAAFINATHHRVLDFVGGQISPEMETPKLLWLKQHMPDTYQTASYFFDLTDYLTWKATSSTQRSLCTTVCKWTYLAHESQWDSTYFKAIGLEEMVDERFARIGTDIVSPGTPLAQGLTKDAAQALGLPAGIAVGAGLIDAHAGGVASVGAKVAGAKMVGAQMQAQTVEPSTALAYVFGTSACTMSSSEQPLSISGVWGPYYGAMVPGMWLSEAGQSAAGAAIEQLMAMHPAYPDLSEQAQHDGLSPVAALSKLATQTVADLSAVVNLADDVHVVPEFLGNRAPFADPAARAVIAGLDMDRSVESLVKLYVAGICGIAYGLRQIIETQRLSGLDTEIIIISGGAGQDPLIRQLLADATQVKVAAPRTAEPVLLGTAMLAAVAAGRYATMNEAMAEMSVIDAFYTPQQGQVQSVHEEKYQGFKALQQVAKTIRNSKGSD